jgi:hypothetical protein
VTFIRTLRPDEVRFELFADPDDEGPEAMLDDEAACWAREQLKSGNRWGWCEARVVAEWGGCRGEASLFGCSYASADDFMQSGYYEYMCMEAMNRLWSIMEDLARQLEPLVSRESVDEWLVGEVQDT